MATRVLKEVNLSSPSVGNDPNFLLNLATADSSLFSISAIRTSATNVFLSAASSISRAAKTAVRPLARAPVRFFILVIPNIIPKN